MGLRVKRCWWEFVAVRVVALTIFLLLIFVHEHIRLHIPNQLVRNDLRTLRNVLYELSDVAHLKMHTV